MKKENEIVYYFPWEDNERKFLGNFKLFVYMINIKRSSPVFIRHAFNKNMQADRSLGCNHQTMGIYTV